MKWLYIILSVLLLSSCRASKSLTDIVATTDTLYVVSIVHDSVSVYRFRTDTILVRDSIIIVVDSAGRETSRREWHFTDATHNTADVSNIKSVKSDSASAIHRSEAYKKEVIEKRPSLWDNLKLALRQLLFVAVAICCIYVYIKNLPRKK